MKFQKVTALLLAACMLFAGCAQKEEAQDVPAAGVAVQVRTVATDNISSDSVVSGQVALENETAVYIMTGALCTEVLVEEGMEVKAGDVICRLDMSTTRENDYSGNTSYLSMDSSYNDQKALLDRQVALYEKTYYDTIALYNIGAASQMEVQSAELQYLSTKVQRDSTLAQLAANMQNYQSNYLQMELAMQSVGMSGEVIAPTDGVISSLVAVEGEMLSSSYPVAVIAGAEQAKIAVSVSESVVPKLKVGDFATVTVSSLGLTFDAPIYSIDRVPNLQTKLFGVVLTVPADVEALRSGTFADVAFHVATANNAVVVPTEAILTANAEQFVFVVEDGSAVKTVIKTGLAGNGMTEVTEGLSAGVEIVTLGQQYLSDGDLVRIVEG